MDSGIHCNVLGGELKLSIQKMCEKTKIIYQQDLAPSHTANTVQGKIKKMKLNVLDWPAKSPDFNPIEMIWSIIDKKLMKIPIYNKETRQKCLEEEWKRLSIDLCQELVDSMPERLHKYLQAKSGHFS